MKMKPMMLLLAAAVVGLPMASTASASVLGQQRMVQYSVWKCPWGREVWKDTTIVPTEIRNNCTFVRTYYGPDLPTP